MKRAILICLIALAIVASLLLGALEFARYKTFAARRDWKNDAIATIVRLAEDKKWIDKEVLAISGDRPCKGQRLLAFQWLSDRMILMGSGEWLIYRSHCRKEPPHNVEDICIAHGSDGKWYYTTCHFCVDMVALMMMQDDQPKNLAEFVRRYHLRPFDGQSNECLQKTKRFPDDYQ